VISPNPTSLLASIKKEKEKAEADMAKRSDNSEHGSSKSGQGNDHQLSSGKKRSRDRSDGSDRSGGSG